jgi:hypothetical protein
MLVHFAPRLFRASVNAVATTSVAVALITANVNRLIRTRTPTTSMTRQRRAKNSSEP